MFTYTPFIDNPYWILGLSQAATRSEIIKAQMAAMKKKQYPVKVISEAQKALMNNDKRLLADFLLPIIPPVVRYRKADLSLLQEPIEPLVPLSKYIDMNDSLRQLASQEPWDEESFLDNHTELKELESLSK